jgi:hypothetical protein
VIWVSNRSLQEASQKVNKPTSATGTAQYTTTCLNTRLSYPARPAVEQLTRTLAGATMLPSDPLALGRRSLITHNLKVSLSPKNRASAETTRAGDI